MLRRSAWAASCCNAVNCFCLCMCVCIGWRHRSAVWCYICHCWGVQADWPHSAFPGGLHPGVQISWYQVHTFSLRLQPRLFMLTCVLCCCLLCGDLGCASIGRSTSRRCCPFAVMPAKTCARWLLGLWMRTKSPILVLCSPSSKILQCPLLPWLQWPLWQQQSC